MPELGRPERHDKNLVEIQITFRCSHHPNFLLDFCSILTPTLFGPMSTIVDAGTRRTRSSYRVVSPTVAVSAPRTQPATANTQTSVSSAPSKRLLFELL